MFFPRSIVSVIAVHAAVMAGNGATFVNAAECTSVESITCKPTLIPPTLDADLSEWTGVDAFETPLTGAMDSKMYAHGNVSIKCVYDAEKIYYAFEIPGKYRFDAADNHLCTSVSTMFQIGEKASLFNMGGCPLADAVDCSAAPGGCSDYLVDIGGHFELKTTERKVRYGEDLDSGTGNNLVANNDDEYAVGPFCRFDDDDSLAANEWAAAWDHTNATDGSMGNYIFEMSRYLKTASNATDAQLQGGNTINFGFAFWDPFENDASGWSDNGHYVTGCSRNWIEMKLVDKDGKVAGDEDVTDTPQSAGNVNANNMKILATTVASVAAYAAM
jgi:hypothetical protein